MKFIHKTQLWKEYRDLKKRKERMCPQKSPDHSTIKSVWDYKFFFQCTLTEMRFLNFFKEKYKSHYFRWHPFCFTCRSLLHILLYILLHSSTLYWNTFLVVLYGSQPNGRPRKICCTWACRNQQLPLCSCICMPVLKPWWLPYGSHKSISA